jgi:hypothetical protein
MCKFNIAIDDALMDKVRPTIDNSVDEAVWVLLLMGLTIKKNLRRGLSNYAGCEGFVSQRIWIIKDNYC